jgi:ABC-2 type transport system permease protein
MIRLLQFEYLKVRPAKYFWVLIGVFGLFLTALPISIHALGEWIVNNVMPDELVLTSIVPFYDFEDIWQNFTFLFQYLTLFLSCLVIINVSREFDLKTIRQHVIDGMSRKEVLWGKILFIVGLAFTITAFVFVLGLVFGGLYSPVGGAEMIFRNIEFLGAYFLHLVHDLLLAMLFAVIIRRPGIATVIFIFYAGIATFSGMFVRYGLQRPLLADLLPYGSTKILIDTPFAKYILWETQDFIRGQDLAVTLGYIAILVLLNAWIIVKKDL